MKKIVLLVVALLCFGIAKAQKIWNIDKEGNSITWQVKKGDVHHDHIEMSGKRVATVFRYGVNKEGAYYNK